MLKYQSFNSFITVSFIVISCGASSTVYALERSFKQSQQKKQASVPVQQQFQTPFIEPASEEKREDARLNYIKIIKGISSVDDPNAATIVTQAQAYAQKNIPDLREQNAFLSFIKRAYDITMYSVVAEDRDKIDEIQQTLEQLKEAAKQKLEPKRLITLENEIKKAEQQVNKLAAIAKKLDKNSDIQKEFETTVTKFSELLRDIKTNVQKQKGEPETLPALLAKITEAQESLEKINDRQQLEQINTQVQTYIKQAKELATTDDQKENLEMAQGIFASIYEPQYEKATLEALKKTMTEPEEEGKDENIPASPVKEQPKKYEVINISLEDQIQSYVEQIKDAQQSLPRMSQQEFATALQKVNDLATTAHRIDGFDKYDNYIKGAHDKFIDAYSREKVKLEQQHPQMNKEEQHKKIEKDIAKLATLQDENKLYEERTKITQEIVKNFDSSSELLSDLNKAFNKSLEALLKKINKPQQPTLETQRTEIEKNIADLATLETIQSLFSKWQTISNKIKNAFGEKDVLMEKLATQFKKTSKNIEKYNEFKEKIANLATLKNEMAIETEWKIITALINNSELDFEQQVELKNLNDTTTSKLIKALPKTIKKESSSPLEKKTPLQTDPAKIEIEKEIKATEEFLKDLELKKSNLINNYNEQELAKVFGQTMQRHKTLNAKINSFLSNPKTKNLTETEKLQDLLNDILQMGKNLINLRKQPVEKQETPILQALYTMKTAPFPSERNKAFVDFFVEAEQDLDHIDENLNLFNQIHTNFAAQLNNLAVAAVVISELKTAPTIIALEGLKEKFNKKITEAITSTKEADSVTSFNFVNAKNAIINIFSHQYELRNQQLESKNKQNIK